MRPIKWIVLLIWYTLYLYSALAYYYSFVLPVLGQALPLAKSVLGGILLTAFFVLMHLVVRAAVQFRPTTTPSIATTPSSPMAYPSPVTVKVGVWLIALAVLLTLGLFFILNSICWPDWIMKCLERDPDLTNAAATMFGAGVGSLVATILAYLEQASDRKDFEVAFAPWYVGRPLMGMLLGLIFYFLLRDGLLAVVSRNSSPETLSEPGLTGVGALVGLFSKEAIEKLRELFNTLFSTRGSVEKGILDRMPPGLRDKVRPYLSSGDDGDDAKSTKR